MRVGKLCRRQSYLIDNCILTVSLVDPSELQHRTGIGLTYPQINFQARGGAAKMKLVGP